jgi:hypothetical protein
VSHTQGKVYIDSKLFGYFEWNGTSDVIIPRVYKTNEELQANWRTEDEKQAGWDLVKDCPHRSDGQIVVDAILYTDYGDGFHWKGQVCIECMVITSNLMPTNWDRIDPDQYPVDGEPIFKSDPKCTCGHPKSWHDDHLCNDGECLGAGDDYGMCGCKVFTEKGELK